MNLTNKSLEMLSLEWEARRFCDQRDIRDTESYERIFAALRHREFMRCIEPFMKLKTRIYSLRMIDRIVLNQDGSLGEIEYKPFPEETQKSLDELEEDIAAEAKRWGFTAPSPTPATPEAAPHSPHTPPRSP